MSTKLKWITFLFCICGISYVSIRHFYNFFDFYKQKKCIQNCKSCILESSAIKDVLDYACNKETIVVFDLDNTLVHPNQSVGSDQWFSYMFKQKLASGLSVKDVLEEILPLYYEVQDRIALYPVEHESPTVLSTLQKKGIKTIALTSRSQPFITRTQEQIRGAGFYFEKTNEFNYELTITMEKNAFLSHGIIFCGNNNKGQTLLKVFEACNCKPQTVIFVDDKLNYVIEVEKECLLNNIQFVGIRYGKLDALVAQFDPVVAEQELESLLGKQASGVSLPA